MISTPIFIDANIQRKVREFFTLHKLVRMELSRCEASHPPLAPALPSRIQASNNNTYWASLPGPLL